jgi:hypothetical protein
MGVRELRREGPDVERRAACCMPGLRCRVERLMGAALEYRIVLTTLACLACASLPYTVRCPERCPRNFVLGGWSSSFKHSDDAGMITASNWTRVMHPEIAAICTRPECRILVAVGTGADVYMGFIAGEPDERVVYYCFVKDTYRRGGIARALFAELGIDPRSRFAYPCETRLAKTLRRKIPFAVHDTAVARYPKQERHRSYAP